MAIFLGLECQLCGIATKGSDRLFDTEAFVWPDSEFYEYSDSYMHWDC
ncbi:MAG: hypothetical protein JWN70_1319 [Planctomycetaceae bacterium]|nr:hypothetical protein [Planctomycetaceae bacterium]